ncbi:hypothetical protein, partial [Bradyrhizobium japonicum]|uniref:hypothetical protein n=2 Tax=Bradyrhizobium TaxID=374 RepID=UPI001AECF91B
MKLDRNLNDDGRGKYGLILNRRVKHIEETYGTADGSAGFAVRRAGAEHSPAATASAGNTNPGPCP